MTSRGCDASGAQWRACARQRRKPVRDPATLSITVFNAPSDAATLEVYRDAGLDRILLEVPDKGRDDVLRLLDNNAALTKG